MNSRTDSGSDGVRLSMVGIVITSLFVALFARLFYLQVLEAPRLAAAAKANQVRNIQVDAPRGRILDVRGRLLAGNREIDVITVQREALSNDRALLSRLAEFLGTPEAVLTQKINDPKVSPYRPIPIATNVDKGVVAAFRERQSEFSGAAAQTQIERYYPEGNLGAHVIGYVGEVNDKELDPRKGKNYRLGDDIGKSGIEAAMETDLRGRPGSDKVEVDVRGEVVRVLTHSPPHPGNDVVIAIDKDIQRAAEDALSQGLQTARGSGAKGLPASGGSVVAIDPRDGSTTAMASFPTFDPAVFSEGIPQREYARLTDPSGPLPLTNRAIQGQYAPGSTFKLITAAAALKSGVITPDSTIVDGGAFYLGSQRFQNAQGRAYGPVSLSRAITVSSDVFFYSLGNRFWEARATLGDPVQATAADFGLGFRHGIGIAGEQPGRIPDPPSRKKLHEERPDVYPEGNWYAGDNVNLAIGQGDALVTPLQLANAYATFANAGTLYRPQLVKKVMDPSGTTLRTVEADVIKRFDLPASVSDPIRQGLTGAIQDRRGTANAAFSGFDFRSFSVAGKTGTAQVTGKADTALFAGYGPTSAPSLAVSVVLEQGGFGGTSAAPVARSVFAAFSRQPTGPITLGTGVD